MGEQVNEWLVDFIVKNYSTARKRVRKDILISLKASLQPDFDPTILLPSTYWSNGSSDREACG